MKEKFDRTKPRVNISEIGKSINETPEEKMARIKITKQKIAGAPIDSTLKEGLNAVLDESLRDLEEQSASQKEQITHHR